MRMSLLVRYLVTSIERVNLVTRHLRGDIIYQDKENPTGQVFEPAKESLNALMLTSLLNGLELEMLELKKVLETQK